MLTYKGMKEIRKEEKGNVIESENMPIA